MPAPQPAAPAPVQEPEMPAPQPAAPAPVQEPAVIVPPPVVPASRPAAPAQRFAAPSRRLVGYTAEGYAVHLEPGETFDDLAKRGVRVAFDLSGSPFSEESFKNM